MSEKQFNPIFEVNIVIINVRDSQLPVDLETISDCCRAFSNYCEYVIYETLFFDLRVLLLYLTIRYGNYQSGIIVGKASGISA